MTRRSRKETPFEKPDHRSLVDLRKRILAFGDATSCLKPRPSRTEPEIRFWTGLEKALMNGDLDFYTKRTSRRGFQGLWQVLRPVLASGQLDQTIVAWVEQRNPTFLEEQAALGNVAGVDRDGWIIFKENIQSKSTRSKNEGDGRYQIE